MNENQIENFRVIGLYSVTQKISLGTELDLVETVPFSISAYHACRNHGGEPPLQKLPVETLMRFYNSITWEEKSPESRNPARPKLIIVDPIPSSKKDILKFPGEDEDCPLSNVQKLSFICNELIRRILNGDVASVRELYTASLDEHPSIIRTISEIQECLTSVEFEEDTDGIYSAEFRYYWAMICCGDTSNLIRKDLPTATTCLEKIKRFVPFANARLAYIELLKSSLPVSASANISRIDILRKWG